MAFFILTEFFSSLISFISPTSFLLFSSSSSSFAAYLLSFFFLLLYILCFISDVFNFKFHTSQQPRNGYVILTLLAVIFSRLHMHVKCLIRHF